MGRTSSGKPITDELVKELADKAELATTSTRLIAVAADAPRSAPPPASVESVRLDPELREALAQRAERDQETPSSVIRTALRKYLQVG